jgi:hypothetical protein
MGDYDQAARYTARIEPEGFFRWIVPRFAASWTFQGWADTATIAFPGDADRFCDLVGEFIHASDKQRRCLVDFEFQSRPDYDMPERFGEYLCRLRKEIRHGSGRSGKYRVHGILVSLTGRAQAVELDMTEPDLDGTGLRLTVLARTLREEEAAATLAEIEADRLQRCVLPWIPLMHGADDPAIIEMWRRLAEQEPNPQRKADFGGLAMVFAELAGCGDLWKQALEDWEVEESKFLKEQRLKGELKGRRTAVLQVLEHRFGGPLPEDLTAAITALSDLDEIDRWLAAAATAESFDSFRETVQQEAGR